MTLAQWIDPDDADQVTLDGDRVTAITDKSSAGNDLAGDEKADVLINFGNAAISPNDQYTTEDDNAIALVLQGGAVLQAGPSPNKWGTNALFIPSGSSSPLQAAVIPVHSPDVTALGTGDFTIEMWVYPTNLTNAGIYDQRTTEPSVYPTIYYNGSLFYFANGLNRITGTTMALNQWHHIAVCRASGTTRLYLNGSQTGANYTDSNNYGSAPVYLGNRSYVTGSSTPMQGYIDSVRIIKGTALYTGASYTVPTRAWQMPPQLDFINYQNRSPGRDILDTAFGSLEKTAASSPALVNMDGPSLTAVVATKELLPTGQDNNAVVYGMRSADVTSPLDDQGWSISLEEGGTIYRGAVGSKEIDLVASDAAMYANFNGADGDTSFTTQDASKRALGFGGGARISTGQAKFGTASVQFDTSPEGYLQVDNYDDALTFGTGDFLIEMWIYNITLPATFFIYDGRSAGTQVAPVIYYTAGGLDYYVNGGTRIAGGALSSGVWQHIALERVSGSTRLYIDGVQTGSTFTDANNYVSVPTMRIGNYALGLVNNSMNGYIDDFRVLKGSFAYGPSPASFSVPTAPAYDSYGAVSEMISTVSLDSSNSMVTAHRTGEYVGAIEFDGTLGFGNDVKLGGLGAPDLVSDARICEAVYYDGALGIDDIRRLEGYLAHKWNMQDSLPATHPFKYRGPDKQPAAQLIANFVGDRDGHAGSPQYIAETGQVATFVSTASLDDNEFKFNGTSLALNGSSDYVTFPDSADYTFDGDFTIECWVYFNTVPTNAGFVSHYDSQSGNNRSWIWGKFGSNLRLYTSTDGANSGVVQFNQAWTPTTGVWYHCAVTRENNTVRLFVDGTQLGTDAAYGSPEALFNCTDVLRIGATRGGSGVTDYMNGNIDSVRIVKGTALYKRNFTVPPRAFRVPLTADLICNFNGQDAIASPPGYVTEDAGARTVAFIGNAQLDTFMKKTGVASLLCDGSGDRVEIAHNVDFEIGANDLTVECMVRFTTDPSTSVECFIGQWSQNASPVDEREWLFYLNNNTLTFAISTDGTGTGIASINVAWNPVVNTWYHLVFERHDDVGYFWIDGVAQGSGALSTTAYSGTAPLVIGGNDEGTQDFTGNIDHVRFFNGRALRGDINARKPEELFDSTGKDAEYAFLWNCEGTDGRAGSPASEAVSDDVAARLLTFTGTAQFDDAEHRVGTTSLSVTTGSNYVTIPQASPDDLALGTDDFTIEFYFKFRSIGGSTIIFDQRASGTQAVPTIYNITNTIYYYVNGANRITGTVTLETAKWYHICVERVAGTTRLYLNGLQTGGDYSDSTNYIGNPIGIGAALYSPVSGTDGWFDMIRISIGRAIYKGDFTPPTAPVGEPIE
ncbi:MAG: LamG domain-containing protein [Gemmatimonadota bacterium]|nr:MAG: LamG domain-containing protein [Gemmatimonadota bacterium]